MRSWRVWILWTDRSEVCGDVEARDADSAVAQSRWAWSGLGALPRYAGIHVSPL